DSKSAPVTVVLHSPTEASPQRDASPGLALGPSDIDSESKHQTSSQNDSRIYDRDFLFGLRDSEGANKYHLPQTETIIRDILRKVKPFGCPFCSAIMTSSVFSPLPITLFLRTLKRTVLKTILFATN